MTEYPVVRIVALKAEARQLLDATDDVSADVVMDIARRLIDVYDDPFGDEMERRVAAAIALDLATTFREALECIDQNAERARLRLDVDDAWPGTPNSIEIGMQARTILQESECKFDWTPPAAPMG